MSAVSHARTPTPTDEIDRCVTDLALGQTRLSQMGLSDRISLLEDCLASVLLLASEWVENACEAKGISVGNPLRSEEVTAGPLATARHLRLLIQNYNAVLTKGRISLPAPPEEGPDGSLRVQVVPVRGLFDAIVFSGFKAHCWLAPSIGRDNLERLGSQLKNSRPAKIVLVLGAGNVSSIPVTDAITKIFQEGNVVLLKMNPVNEYLGPTFERLFGRMADEGLVRIIYGGVQVGAAAVDHPQVDEVHITGSIYSHDAIVWGPCGPERQRRLSTGDPVLKKPITSELGNVSPWIIVPGPYSQAQLRFQAENVAASIVNNASFNCVATKMIITWRDWPQRTAFLDLVESVLAQVPRRRAYYPGAHERFGRFSGQVAPPDPQGTLPWKLIRDAEPETSPELFCEESFVCVCAETSLEAQDEQEFVDQAVEFANGKLWGTLSAALTVHPSFRRATGGEACFQRALAKLRYGSIGVNHWPALLYAMMSPPWGGHPTVTLSDAQSGIGTVHNTFMLEAVQKTVLEGPLAVWPKPFWFPTHRRPEPIAWKVLDLYARPSAWKLPGLMLSALGG